MYIYVHVCSCVRVHYSTCVQIKERFKGVVSLLPLCGVLEIDLRLGGKCPYPLASALNEDPNRGYLARLTGSSVILIKGESRTEKAGTHTSHKSCVGIPFLR